MRPAEAALAAPAAPVFLYFFFRPEADAAACAVALSLWFLSMILDLCTTLRRARRIPGQERSALLRRLYARFPGWRAAALAGAAESASVALLPAALLWSFDPGASSAVSFLFACLHAEAVLANDRFAADEKRPRPAGQDGSETP